jgi:hypothetical protein
VKATLNTSKRIYTGKKCRVNGILSYDIDNKYQQRVLDIISNSGTASSCVELFSSFIQGKGFRDTTFYKAIINNKGITNDVLLKKLGDNWASLSDFSVHFNYNVLGEISEINYIPSWYLRLPDYDNREYAGKIALYDDWDMQREKRVDEKKIAWYNPYNPNTVVDEIEEVGGIEYYKGQILWYAYENGRYSLSHADPVLEDMQTEGKSKTYKYRNISTNFLASHILITDKKEDISNQPSEEENNEGSLVRRRIQETDNSFDEAFEDFQGSDEALKIMKVEKTHPEQTFELKKVDIQDVEDLYQFTEESCRDNIIRRFTQPPVLVGVQVAGKLGSSSKEIQEAREFYDSITYKSRLLFEQLFERIFSNFHDKSINPSGDYSIIPISETIVESSIIKELGVGVLQTIVSIITDVRLSGDQKKTVLTVLGLDEESVNKLSIDPQKTIV